LHDAQWTNDAAIKSPEEENHYDEKGYNGSVESQEGRQELDFGYPTRPKVYSEPDAEQQQGYQGHHDHLQANSDFS
jgi:hypothetical protein